MLLKPRKSEVSRTHPRYLNRTSKTSTHNWTIQIPDTKSICVRGASLGTKCSAMVAEARSPLVTTKMRATMSLQNSWKHPQKSGGQICRCVQPKKPRDLGWLRLLRRLREQSGNICLCLAERTIDTYCAVAQCSLLHILLLAFFPLFFDIHWGLFLTLRSVINITMQRDSFNTGCSQTFDTLCTNASTLPRTTTMRPALAYSQQATAQFYSKGQIQSNPHFKPISHLSPSTL